MMVSNIPAVHYIMDLMVKNEDRVNRSELDTHADTCVAGDNMVLLERTGMLVSVSPYSDEYESLKGIPVATCATAFDCPKTGETFVLIFNETL